MGLDISEIIAGSLDVKSCDIINVELIKYGMTNVSYLFDYKEKRYIIRLPGEGTEFLINRKYEADIYQLIANKKLSDDVIYFNPDSGVKISKYWNNARVCDPNNIRDVSACIKKLKRFHEMNLQVSHSFDLFENIEYYEMLWRGKPSIYSDYSIIKKNVFSLKSFIDKYAIHKCLSHIDAISDNFLILPGNEVRLIDWEYAAMQDPHIDIAMFCIYSLCEREKIDGLIDIYFDNQCPDIIRLKIYCYISSCGLLWSNWCEYKRHLGIEFGEYAYRQYNYAKEYYAISHEMLEVNEDWLR